MPAKWSGVLVVHAHGGPSLGTPKTTRNDEDIKRGPLLFVKVMHGRARSFARVALLLLRLQKIQNAFDAFL